MFSHSQELCSCDILEQPNYLIYRHICILKFCLGWYVPPWCPIKACLTWRVMSAYVCGLVNFNLPCFGRCSWFGGPSQEPVWTGSWELILSETGQFPENIVGALCCQIRQCRNTRAVVHFERVLTM